MKRLAALLVTAGLLAGAADAAAASEQKYDPRCSNAHFRAFSKRVWDLDHWQRGKPRRVALRARTRRLGCAPHRLRARAAWRRDKRQFYDYREYRMLNPYWGCTIFGGCRFYALPAYVVNCESGGDYTPTIGSLGFGGMYGLLIETWQSFGGSTYAANEAPPREQDRIAGIVWATVGPSGWACA